MRKDIDKSFVGIIVFLAALTLFIYIPLGKEFFKIIFKYIANEDIYEFILFGIVLISCVFLYICLKVFPLSTKFKYVKIIVTYLFLLLLAYMSHLLLFIRFGMVP